MIHDIMNSVIQAKKYCTCFNIWNANESEGNTDICIMNPYLLIFQVVIVLGNYNSSFAFARVMLVDQRWSLGDDDVIHPIIMANHKTRSAVAVEFICSHRVHSKYCKRKSDFLEFNNIIAPYTELNLKILRCFYKDFQ